MSTTIIILIISIIIVILGLLLSGTGSNAGLGNVTAQDLEIFKKTKDRGIIKILQFIMFIAFIALTITVVVVAITGTGDIAPPVEQTTPPSDGSPETPVTALLAWLI